MPGTVPCAFTSINPLNPHSSPVRFDGTHGSMELLAQGWYRVLPFLTLRSQSPLIHRAYLEAENKTA